MTTRPNNPHADELIGKYFSVLDYGFVSLVDYMGTDQCVERAARTSFGKGTRSVSDTRTLLRYLKRHLHTTPFEMVELKFHCAMPIFVARQWIRHRTANVNEYSGRYSLVPAIFYTPDQEHVKLQSTTNRQGRSDAVLEESKYQKAVAEWSELREHASNLYDWLNGEQVARELARIDLPLSTYTQWYWKIDLHNLMHFLKLRVDSHAQYEIRAYGEVMAGIMMEVAPLSTEAWIDYDVAGARFSHAELEHLRGGALLGLSQREIDEFSAKMKPKDRPVFTLPASHHDAAFYERIYEAK
jgi:thymidylate synthase (FAD)